ncbi:hypothetical protein J6590_060331 [Homalodisca vitripennis]|nr:hypothetical protein J6590_060331 [Homalodisca vitripennis]
MSLHICSVNITETHQTSNSQGWLSKYGTVSGEVCVPAHTVTTADYDDKEIQYVASARNCHRTNGTVLGRHTSYTWPSGTVTSGRIDIFELVATR